MTFHRRLTLVYTLRLPPDYRRVAATVNYWHTKQRELQEEAPNYRGM